MRSTSARLLPILLSAALGTGQALAAPPPPEDRAAILAMQGEYAVRFHFQETVPLSPGYEVREAKDSGALEVVILVEDAPTKIVLQHLLVSPKGHVTKHWRQDWMYEAPERFEFVAEQTWRLRPLAPEETAGKWTQCVYEVSDAPRYCGTGAWNHKYGNPTWTSDRSWRPLPRREYTVRSDYNALNVENRHTITPVGWTHEQDNSKVRREGERSIGTLTREFGFNDYRRTTATDFGPAYRYWQATAPFWAEVRARWQAALASGGLVLETPVDGMPVIEALFELAAKRENGDAVEARAIDGVFARHVRPLAAAGTTAQR